MPYPKDNEIFTLTHDFDAPENQPLEMVRKDGYVGEWKFTGKKMTGVQTEKFKLVRIGACENLYEVREKLAKYGELPDGRWREAFKAAFPKHDGNGPVGFAYASWIDPSGCAHFPFVYSDGDSDFSWAELGLDEFWRWLVPASKSLDTLTFGTSLVLGLLDEIEEKTKQVRKLINKE